MFSFFCIVVCRTHFNLLPYELVKPILDSATPEQLNLIIDNNAVKKNFFFSFFHNFFIYLKNYIDDVEPLWQHFCSLHFKDAQREECETYYELYRVQKKN